MLLGFLGMVAGMILLACAGILHLLSAREVSVFYAFYGGVWTLVAGVFVVVLAFALVICVVCCGSSGKRPRFS